MTDYSLVSVDIETTGPSPANGWMCSIGAVFLDEDRNVGKSYFSINLVKPDWGRENDDTMAWWKRFPEQWKAHRQGCVSVVLGMREFDNWIHDSVPGKPVFVAWPVGFDWGFINYYCHRYLGFNPFGYSPLCLKNYAAGVLRNPGMLMGTREEAGMPEGWLVTPEDCGLLPHIAINDAVAQAYMIRNIMQYSG